MSDFFSSIGEGIGDVAQGAYDFLAPQTERRGQGFSIGNAINSLGEAISDSPLGALTKIPDLIRSDSGWGEKFLLSGAIAAGGFMSARHYFGASKLEAGLAEREAIQAATPSRSQVALDIGLKERYSPSTVEGEAVRQRWPGVTARTADVLGAKDYRGLAYHLTDLSNPDEVGRAAGIIDDYSTRLADVDPSLRFGAAQGDWAKLQTAIDGKLIVGDRNGDLMKLWKQFRQAPSSMTPEQAVALQDYVQRLGDITRGIIEPDMTFDLASKVTQIDLSPTGVEIHVSSPHGWSDGRSENAAVRSARLKELNLRAMTARAEGILNYLLDKGLEDPDKYLERSDHWYGNVAAEISSRLASVQERHPWLDVERFTAAVSLTSEATDWDQNIPMAEAALDMLLKVPAEDSEKFQTWLAGGLLEPSESKRFERLFKDLHDDVTAKEATKLWRDRQAAAKVEWKKIPPASRPAFSSYFTEKSPGNFLSTQDLKKVMRLATSTGSEIFASMPGAPKQKSFYLNMLDPTNPDPVTVDRHAYDIFLGLASHSDFKGLEGLNLSESNYEIIADVYRKVAAQRGLLPNQVQGTTWQTWRVMKDEWGYISHNWEDGRGPFRLPELDGSPNVVWETLNGRPNGALKDIYSVMPERLVWVTGGTGSGPYILPDGSAGLAMRHTREVADQYRTLRPAITRQDGVSLYLAGAPRRVDNVSTVENDLQRSLRPGYVTERSSADAWGGTHPAEANTQLVVFEVPEDGRVPDEFQDRLVSSGEPVVADEPSGIPEGLRPVSIDEFVRARRFLNEAKVQKGGTTADQMLSHIPDNPTKDWKNHRFWLNEDATAGFAIAPDGDLQQVFNSSPVKGYGSQMVTYAKAQGATKLDFFDGEFLDDGTVGPGYLKQFYEKHGFQETSRDTWNPEYDDLRRPVGPDVAYMGLDESAHVPSPRESRTVRRYAVQPTPAEQADLGRLAAKLESAGMKIHGIYAPGPAPDGWKLAKEHVYSDGVNKLVVRTADQETLSPHGFNVWVRDADHVHLPDSNPLGQRFATEQIRPTKVGEVFKYGGLATGGVDIFDSKVRAFSVSFGPYGDALPSIQPMIGATSMPFDGPFVGEMGGRRFTPGTVRKVGDRFLITAVDPSNITDDVRIYDLLAAMGVPEKKIVLSVGAEASRLTVPDPKSSRLPQSIVFDYDVHPLRRTSIPLPEFRDRYGTFVDPHARRPWDGKLASLADEHVPHLDDGLAAFYDDPVRAAIAKMAGFDRIGLSFDAPKGVGSYGWYFPKHGGSIALGGGLFSEPGKLFESLSYDQSINHMNPTLPTNASAILAHELGHMVHNGVLLSFRTKGASGAFMKDLLKVYKKLGDEGVAREVSIYAQGHVDEFIAETVAEAILSPNPRPVALEVYNMLVEQFKANTAATPSISLLTRGGLA